MGVRTSYLNWRSSGIWDWVMWAFCWVCFCCSGCQHTGLLVTSTALGFLHVQLPSCELSASWASAVLGLRLMGAEPRLLQLGYIRVTATGMSGDCVISSVLSCCSKYLTWKISVTTWLQLSFIQQAKGGWIPKQRSQSVLASFFYTFVSSPSWACPMQIGLAKKGACLFHLKFSMWSLDIFLVPFLWAFPFFVF